MSLTELRKDSITSKVEQNEYWTDTVSTLTNGLMLGELVRPNPTEIVLDQWYLVREILVYGDAAGQGTLNDFIVSLCSKCLILQTSLKLSYSMLT